MLMRPPSILSLSDPGLSLEPMRGTYCPRCRKPSALALGGENRRGLIRGCCCGITDCCAAGYGSVEVTLSGLTACALTCREMCGADGGDELASSMLFTQIDGLNGTYKLRKTSENAFFCVYRTVTDKIVKLKIDTNNTDCSVLGTEKTAAVSIAVHVRKSNGKIYLISIGTSVFGGVITSFYFENAVGCASQDEPFGVSISNLLTDCANTCVCGRESPFDPVTNSHYGGTAVVTPLDCCECEWCYDCSDADEVTCPNSECCTPDTIRLTTSSITVAFGCINGTTAKWKLAGTTAANRTIDLLQDATDKCKWEEDVASDWVLTKATSYALSTLTYRATKTSSTNWHMEVFASGGGQTVYFFDGNVTTLTGECFAIAAASNGLSCDLCATPITAGNSGTFTTTGAGSGTSCANCTLTPATLSATIADVVTCTDTCVCTSRYSLTGSTAINRTITLNQTASPCVFEAMVGSADWVLYDFDTAAATHTIDSLRYRLRRVAATTNGWSYDVVGMKGATEWLSIVGTDGASCTFTSITSDATANKCADTITAPTHPTRTACIVDATAKGKVGSGGSSTLDVCPV